MVEDAGRAEGAACGIKLISCIFLPHIDRNMHGVLDTPICFRF